MSQIFGALKFEDTDKGLDYVINRALDGDNWIEKPPTVADEQNWFQGLTTHKPMPSSSQIKNLGPKIINADPYNFHGHKKHNCFHGTSAKEDRIAARKNKECGESFIVKIEKYRNVNHSPENLVWKIPGFCYLECINLALERGHFWPANPTVYTFTNFRQKYRKPINFCLVETEPGKHFTVRTFPGGDSTLAWKHMVHIIGQNPIKMFYLQDFHAVRHHSGSWWFTLDHCDSHWINDGPAWATLGSVHIHHPDQCVQCEPRHTSGLAT